MKKALCELLKVKSIVTIATLAVFCVLSVRGDVDGDKFMTIFTVIVSFYFGTKFEQNNNRLF